MAKLHDTRMGSLVFTALWASSLKNHKGDGS